MVINECKNIPSFGYRAHAWYKNLVLKLVTVLDNFGGIPKRGKTGTIVFYGNCIAFIAIFYIFLFLFFTFIFYFSKFYYCTTVCTCMSYSTEFYNYKHYWKLWLFLNWSQVSDNKCIIHFTSTTIRLPKKTKLKQN